VSINPQVHPELQPGQHRLHHVCQLSGKKKKKNSRSLAWALRTDLRAPASPPLMMLPAFCSRTFSSAVFPAPARCRASFSSTLTPTITYNTIDNPTNQHSGKKKAFSIHLVSPVARWAATVKHYYQRFLTGKYFHPIQKNVVMSSAFTPGAAYTTGFGGKEVPPYSRFYMGGEKTMFAASISVLSRRSLLSRRLRRCPSPFTTPPLAGLFAPSRCRC